MCGLLFIANSQRDSHFFLSHRGPDATSIHHLGPKDEDFTLVHKRLSIVDTERGTQPFNASGDLTIFNGEIFNCPRPKTEVEYLSELLHENHPNLHALLNGYYGIIQVRKNRKEVRAFRDPFGVIPLYYTRSPFSISSERQALDQRASKQFEVPPGGCLTYSLLTGKVKVTKRSLYDVFHFSKRLVHSVNLRPLFDTAVRRTAKHTESGFSLAFSGGLDSSLILASLVRQGLTPAEIITVKSNGGEMERARYLIEFFELGHLWKIVEPENPSLLFLDASLPGKRNPIRDFAFSRHLAVARAASTKVILCGEGADELDFGYINEPKEVLAFNALSDHARLKKKVALLHGMARFSLDRVNLAGMRYSKEFRVPFLDMNFAQAMLQAPLEASKDNLRRLAAYMDLPLIIVNAPKFGSAETEGRKSAMATTTTTTTYTATDNVQGGL